MGADPARRLVARRPDQRGHDRRGSGWARRRCRPGSARAGRRRARSRRGRVRRRGPAARRSRRRPPPCVSAVASSRLTANSPVASTARRSASAARSRPSAARRPTASATIRTRTRLSSSLGSATAEREAGFGEQEVVDEERDDGRDDRRRSCRPTDPTIDHRRRGRPPRRRGSRSPASRMAMTSVPTRDRDDGERARRDGDDAGRPQRRQPLDDPGLHRRDGTSGRRGGTKRQVGTSGYTKVRLGGTPPSLIRSATQRAGPYP